MKKIIKLSEPNSLVQHRASQYANFNNIPRAAKEELRQSLLSEQGHICCYCMKRIPEKNGSHMKVEHFKCQESHNDLQLDYSNLFAACTGNEGQPKIKQTCDTKKGNLELSINPFSSHPDCETLFRYNPDGEISSISNNKTINDQLNKVLNLNMETLKAARREVYLSVQERVRVEGKKTSKPLLKFLKQERDSWMRRRNDGKYRPYCSVAVYYLTKKIKSQN